MRKTKLITLITTVTLAAVGTVSLSVSRNEKPAEINAAGDWTLNIKFNGSLPDWANTGSSLGLHFGGAWTNNDSSDWGWSKDVYVGNNGTTTAKFGEYERIRVVQGVFYQNSDKKETYVLNVSPKLDLNYDGAYLTFTLPSVLSWDGAMISNASCAVGKNNVTLNLNGGSCSQLTSYYTGVKTNLPTASKTGFNFLGWSKNQDLTGDLYTNIPKGTTGDQTFYAVYEAIPQDCTITFDANGGTLSGNESVVVSSASTLSKPTDPIKTNCSFDGWYIGDEKVVFPYQPSSNVTMVAHWKVNNGTYLTGTFIDSPFSRDGQVAMKNNPDKTGEVMIEDFTVVAGTKVKVYYANNGSVDWDNAPSPTWSYNNPSLKEAGSIDEDKNFVISQAGTYTLYFDTVNKNYHLCDKTLAENGRYFVKNNGVTKETLIKTESVSEGLSGVTEYRAVVSFAKGDKLCAYYQDANTATTYPLTQANGQHTNWSKDGDFLICPVAGEYTLIMYSSDGGNNYPNISIQIKGEVEAISYANEFNTKIGSICKLDGSTDVTKLPDEWSTQKTNFTALSNDAKTVLKSETSNNDQLRNFIEKYEYICSHKSLENFMEVTLTRSSSKNAFGVFGENPITGENSSSIWVAIATSLVAATAVGGFFFYKKRKEN